jgi:acetyl esterase/lipase
MATCRRFAFRVLLYPRSDMSMSQGSYKRDWTQYPLSIEAIKYFIGHYLSGEKDYTDWRAAPLTAPNFKGLADAFVLTAGRDPLARWAAWFVRPTSRWTWRAWHLQKSSYFLPPDFTLPPIVRRPNLVACAKP